MRTPGIVPGVFCFRDGFLDDKLAPGHLDSFALKCLLRELLFIVERLEIVVDSTQSKGVQQCEEICHYWE